MTNTDISLYAAIVEEIFMFNNGKGILKNSQMTIQGKRGNGKIVTMQFVAKWTTDSYAMIKNVVNNDLYILRKNPVKEITLYSKNGRLCLVDVVPMSLSNNK